MCLLSHLEDEKNHIMPANIGWLPNSSFIHPYYIIMLSSSILDYLTVKFWSRKMAGVKGVFKELWWFKSTIIMLAAPVLLSLMLPFYEQMGLTEKVLCSSLFIYFL